MAQISSINISNLLPSASANENGQNFHTNIKMLMNRSRLVSLRGTVCKQIDHRQKQTSRVAVILEMVSSAEVVKSVFGSPVLFECKFELQINYSRNYLSRANKSQKPNRMSPNCLRTWARLHMMKRDIDRLADDDDDCDFGQFHQWQLVTTLESLNGQSSVCYPVHSFISWPELSWPGWWTITRSAERLLFVI